MPSSNGTHQQMSALGAICHLQIIHGMKESLHILANLLVKRKLKICYYINGPVN